MSVYICPYTCSYRTNAGHCGKTGGYESCQYIKHLEELEKKKNASCAVLGVRLSQELYASAFR